MARRDELLSRTLQVLSAAGLELDGTELLDALWLAGRLPGAAGAAPLGQAESHAGERGPGKPAAPREGATTRASAPTGPDEPPALPSFDEVHAHLHAAPAAPPSFALRPPPSDAALPLQVPEHKALHGELGMARALRPLKQRRPSSRSQEFDEVATAAELAETGLPDVVVRPVRERWLDLALLVDDGMSMLLWRRVVVELRMLMQRMGAFRVVRVHGLDTRCPQAPRLRGRPFDPGSASVPPTVLTDPSGRTLVLVISDGMGGAWRDGRMHAALTSWAAAGPTAVLHTLPRRLWVGSGVRTERWQVSTRRRGAVNTSWHVTDAVLPPELSRFEGTPVPVLEPTASSMAGWARLLASPSDTAPLDLLLPPTARAERLRTDSVQDVQRFRDAASPEAYRLAAHLAAVAPVSVPVMRLVQGAVPWPADTTHLAEVFLGGLMRPAAAPLPGPLPAHHRIFDFTELAKDALLDAVPAPELMLTSRRIGRQIEALAGRSPDFPAWLAHPTGTDHIPLQRRAFTAVERRLMVRFGAPADPLPASGTEPGTFDPTGWDPLTTRDPRRLGPYTLYRRLTGTRSVLYLGKDSDGKDAAIRTVRPGQPPETQRILAAEAEALRRMAGRYAPELLGTDFTTEPPWIAMQLMQAQTRDRGQPLALGDLIRSASHHSQLPFDTLTGFALGWHIAAAVSLCHLQGIVLRELSVDTVNVVGRQVVLTGWADASLDGVPSDDGSTPDPAENVRDLGRILSRIGGSPDLPAPSSRDMPRWQSDTWRPIREVITACLSPESDRRPTARQVADEFARYIPPEAGRPGTPRPIGPAIGPAGAGRPVLLIPVTGRPAPEPPDRPLRIKGGWRSRLKAGGEAAETERRRKLAQLRVPLQYSHRVAVLGAHRGAARTTVTLLLGELLASVRQGGVLALEAEAEGRAIGTVATEQNPATLRDLLTARPRPTGYEEIRRFTWRTSSGLHLISRDTQGADGPLYNDEYRHVIELVSPHFPVVLAGWGDKLLDKRMSGALDLTDRVVLACTASPDSLGRAEYVLHRLNALGHARLVEQAVIAVTRTGSSPRFVSDSEVADRFRHCGGVVTIPEDDRLARGPATGLSQIRPRTLSAVLELACRIAEGFPQE
ncbi:SAV_2336 N-terminal domain-related protein [Streptomyces sp. NPDC051219]|uniref:SAV_2336 N-terminal domain-related protein n=1 Tax=Streptomyces sp. NPDC051219 TaxID=3155283 RepID=UPI00343243E1